MEERLNSKWEPPQTSNCFNEMTMRLSNYNKTPVIHSAGKVYSGWTEISQQLQQKITSLAQKKCVVVFELYPGIHYHEIIAAIQLLVPSLVIESEKCFKSEEEIKKLTFQDVTEDDIFGYMTRLSMEDFLDPEAKKGLAHQIELQSSGTVVVIGHGAALIPDNYDLLVYADMARWEIQLRMKQNEVHGLGLNDSQLPYSHQYKRGYFVDWRVCDKLKKSLFSKMDYVLDTNHAGLPKMIPAEIMFNALKKASLQPFRVVPYFDPGPWGGQWMKNICGLDPNKINYAWCFDCVPEENSLLLNIEGSIFEIPSINLVFCESKNLLGEPVEARFGQEFPIRFDFLDTMEGGNLSLQVHPTTQYIRDAFGMNYTQDESYYLLDTKEDAKVYLGTKIGIDPQQMISELLESQKGITPFETEKFVNSFPAKKHDHFLIPAGTVHCSGANSMVLEISATPYIFTFKMWDWARLGLDGKPRPINIGHAAKVIQWERDTEYTKNNLVNQISTIETGDGWMEEKTGLHPNEFIETRRHWFTKTVLHQTNNSVNVLNLVEGEEAIVESPDNLFEPFTVHYAETFIVPAAVRNYTIRPSDKFDGKELATLKAYVRC